MRNLLCPNDPPCGHYWHDVEDFGDPVPMCCEESCRCGKTEEDARIRHRVFDGPADSPEPAPVGGEEP